jgi:hypothetical protein
MAKVSLAKHMLEQFRLERSSRKVGPFVTLSRQYGCYGFSLGLLLQEILNEELPASASWKVYGKYILEGLARETHMAEEALQQERLARPHLILDFFRGFSESRIPSGYEIRRRITVILRKLAIGGRAILVGQGSTPATTDLPNGLSVRLEAPEEWRVQQISIREGIGAERAMKRIRDKEKEREYLREFFAKKFPRTPPFHLTFDCSVFTLAQIARQVALALQQKGMAAT